MFPPPATGDPYTLIPAGAPNPGFQGVLVGWDSVRFFWGLAAQQGWMDLLNITNIGKVTLV